MSTQTDIKKLVKEKYSEIAQRSEKQNQKPCCCGDNKKELDYSIMADDYSMIDGYVQEADLGLGCGLPTEQANIQEGFNIIDLGSGAGNDVFIARKLVGESGKVIGIDFSEDMIEKARKNCDKLGYNNVEFRLGEIEELPAIDKSADVVLSNCVLNLVPDKKAAFMEIFRVLKGGGRFCVSDIVLKNDLPKKLREPAELYAGCVAGAEQKDEYLNIINNVGFIDIKVVKEKEIIIPDHILSEYLSEDEIKEYKNDPNPISSITVVGERPVRGCCIA